MAARKIDDEIKNYFYDYVQCLDVDRPKHRMAHGHRDASPR